MFFNTFFLMIHHKKLNDALHIIIREAHRLRLSLILILIFEFSKIKHLKTFWNVLCFFPVFRLDNTILLIVRSNKLLNKVIWQNRWFRYVETTFRKSNLFFYGWETISPITAGFFKVKLVRKWGISGCGSCN